MNTPFRSLGHRSLGIGLAVAVLASMLSAWTPAQPAAALSGSSFDPGLIISDEQFYDRDAMTESQIQAFLEKMSGICSNSNCLDVYRQATTTRDATTRCARYEGASDEPAARIIFKVQAACGISAKALLVTLQKEQGLVTSTGPSDTRLRIAMGYGCPDTAPCDALYYGFYNQVYSAASQFQRYRLSPSSFKHQIGTESIYYHPDSFVVSPPRCGTRTVAIRNAATAGLYNYTPYTPNAASLSNLYGTGDSCSSYGNRNFWRFFYEWFGDPTLTSGASAIDLAWRDSGGAEGALGEPTGADDCTVTTDICRRAFEGGTIYWGRSTGARPVLAILDASYRASGGPRGDLGLPTGFHVDAVTSTGRGALQTFADGNLYAIDGDVFRVSGTSRDRYAELSTVRGPLGWPTSDRVCIDGLCQQSFQGGAIDGSAATGIHAVYGAMFVKYSTFGGADGRIGIPVTSRVVETTTAAEGARAHQRFASGSLYEVDAQVLPVVGSIEVEHVRTGRTSGPMGMPTSAHSCSAGICSQAFDGGFIYSVGSTGVRSVVGAIAREYDTAGKHQGDLGLPTSQRSAIAARGAAGFVQAFQRGRIFQSSLGTFSLTGSIATEHARIGGPEGLLGWPVEARECGDGWCSQRFQLGSITETPKGAFLVRQAYHRIHQSLGGSSGELGHPLSNYTALTSTANGDGVGQRFARGSIYSSSSGAFAVIGSMRDEYWRRGSVTGPLGWPTSAQNCTDGSCTQSFQGGTLTVGG